MNTEVIVDYVPETLLAKVRLVREEKKFLIDQPYTKEELIRNITDKLNISYDSKIAVFYTVEWALYLRMRGYSDVTVITKDHDYAIQRMSDIGWFKYSTLDQVKNMKFDNVVGNPPFSSGDELLYVKFFSESLNMANSVAMIFPYSENSRAPKLKSHYRRIQRHSTFISSDVSSYFSTVSVGDIRYVIASSRVNNPVVAVRHPLADYQNILPERNRLIPITGSMAINNLKNVDENNGVKCIASIYRGDVIGWRSINKSIANKIKTSDSPWLVIFQRATGNGLLNSVVIKNNNIKFSGGCLAIGANSKEEAERIKSWITSDTIRSELLHVMTLLNLRVKSVTADIISRLPTYR